MLQKTLKHFLISQLIKFFLPIDQSKASKYCSVKWIALSFIMYYLHSLFEKIKNSCVIE